MAKQLTKEERLRIYRGIGNKESLSAIAKALGKDRSTIAREIKRNRVLRHGSLPADKKCMKDRAGCSIAHLCNEICMRTSCWHCAKGCGDSCPGYEENICPGIVNPPYVCNACSRRSRCHLDRYFYDPAEADAAYRDRLSGSRSGYSMDEDEVMMTALDAGAEDFNALDDAFEVYTTPGDFSAVREAVEANKDYVILDAGVQMIPSNTVTPSKEAEVKIRRLLDMLEDNDDVQNVYHNAELSEDDEEE